MKSFITVFSKPCRGLALIALALFLALGLSACRDTGEPPAPDQEQEATAPPPPPAAPAPPETRVDPCRRNCELTVTLPAEPGKRPSVSDSNLNVQGGVKLAVILDDESSGSPGGTTVLEFSSKKESAFVQCNGQRKGRKTVSLTPGRNVVCVRSYTKSECKPSSDPNVQGGCKYDVISSGRGKLDPYVIIWQ